MNRKPLIEGLSGWLGPESNQRHKDFQSSALPTELPGHIRIGNALKKVGKNYRRVFLKQKELM